MNKIFWMGGLMEEEVTTLSEYLVTEETESAKYRAAAARRMAVVLPTWVEECWRRSVYETLGAEELASLTAQYRTPPFAKLVITASGLSRAAREKCYSLIAQLGGRSTFDLRRSACTHLVAETTDCEQSSLSLFENESLFGFGGSCRNLHMF